MAWSSITTGGIPLEGSPARRKATRSWSLSLTTRLNMLGASVAPFPSWPWQCAQMLSKISLPSACSWATILRHQNEQKISTKIDPFGDMSDYIKTVKPYTSKLRDFNDRKILSSVSPVESEINITLYFSFIILLISS